MVDERSRAVRISRKLKPGVNDLATRNPELAEEWDYERNDKTPAEVTFGSAELAHWICRKDPRHIWTAKISNRAHGRGCPVCSNHLVLPGVNDLASEHPDIASEWDEVRNYPARVDQVASGSNRIFWWICPKGHHYHAKAISRTGPKQSQCAVCENRQIEIGVNDLPTTRPDLVAEIDWDFHPDLDPSTLTTGSGIRLHWKCSEGHRWEATVINRGRPASISDSGRKIRGTGCSKCNREGSGRRATPDYNLAVTHPQLALDWDFSLNERRPEEYTKGVADIVAWICPEGHKWRASIINRAYLGQGCPVCANQETVEGFNDLATKFPEIAAEWHPTKNQQSPTKVQAGTPESFWWLCDSGHAFKSSVVNRTRNGSGCRTCANMGFDPTDEGYLYLLRNDVLGLQQFGITNTPKRRLATHKKNGWEVIDLVGPADGYWVAETELAIKHFLRDKGVLLSRNHEEKFDGYTESWFSESFAFDSLPRLLGALRTWET